MQIRLFSTMRTFTIFIQPIRINGTRLQCYVHLFCMIPQNKQLLYLVLKNVWRFSSKHFWIRSKSGSFTVSTPLIIRMIHQTHDSSGMRLLQPAAEVFYGIYKQRVSTQRLATHAHRCCSVKRKVNSIKPHLCEKKETEYARLIYIHCTVDTRLKIFALWRQLRIQQCLYKLN